MNHSLVEEVLEIEFFVSISPIKKGKSPRPNDLTMEFFLGFYDLLKEDLLKVVRGVPKDWKYLGSFNSNFISLIPKKQYGASFQDY
jgi:hypothetical protein